MRHRSQRNQRLRGPGSNNPVLAPRTPETRHSRAPNPCDKPVSDRPTDTDAETQKPPPRRGFRGGPNRTASQPAPARIPDSRNIVTYVTIHSPSMGTVSPRATRQVHGARHRSRGEPHASAPRGAASLLGLAPWVMGSLAAGGLGQSRRRRPSQRTATSARCPEGLLAGWMTLVRVGSLPRARRR